MANPRPEHAVDQSMQETVRKVAEETSRAGRMFADVGERTFHAQAQVFQHNAEALQRVLQSGNEVAARLASRSADQFARAFGIGGDEAETAVEQSRRNLSAVVQSSAQLSQSMQTISNQWVEFLQQQAEQCMHR